MFEQDLTPVANSLTLSALIALLPLLTIFVMLGGLRTKAHVAGLTALAVAILVAILAYGMPAKLALLSATQGGVFGLFPIMWIVFNALWVYQLTVVSGRFEDLRASFSLISDDPRIMAVLIAFCFGGLLEALAGFGAPVAITGVMLMALGFSPFKAATVVLLANTAPVAYGAIATPILTAGTLTGIPYEEIGAIVGRQTPVLALFVPLVLVGMVDGKRGIRQTWPAALVCGVVFAIAQYVSSNFISVELTDIIAALAALGATIAFLRVWKPTGTAEAIATLAQDAREEERLNPTGGSDGEIKDPRDGAGNGGGPGSTRVGAPAPTRELTNSRIGMALLPYIIIIVVFSIARLVPSIKDAIAGTDQKIPWPGLDGQIIGTSGKAITSTIYNFQWLSSPGSLLLICGVLVMLVYKIGPASGVREYFATAYKLRYAFLTVASVLALAYVMNQSGQTLTIGNWIAATGAFFAFLSPILGWLGTAVTGSDTSANALFATLQQTAGREAGINETLLVAANTSGGVVGKMISPQNLTIAATAVGIVGREGELFRFLIRWSIGLILFICVLVYLQSTSVLGWMV
jgi:lactate permease